MLYFIVFFITQTPQEFANTGQTLSLVSGALSLSHGAMNACVYVTTIPWLRTGDAMRTVDVASEQQLGSTAVITTKSEL